MLFSGYAEILDLQSGSGRSVAALIWCHISPKPTSTLGSNVASMRVGKEILFSASGPGTNLMK